MSNANKRRGDAYERDLLRALEALGVTVHRTLNAGIPHDLGDLLTATVCVQAKNHARLDLAGWTDQATEQAARSGRLPAVAHKRKQHNAADSYVTMPAWAWAELVRRAEEGR